MAIPSLSLIKIKIYNIRRTFPLYCTNPRGKCELSKEGGVAGAPPGAAAAAAAAAPASLPRECAPAKVKASEAGSQ